MAMAVAVAVAGDGEGEEDVPPGFARQQPDDAAPPRVLRPRPRELVDGLAADRYCQADGRHEQWNSRYYTRSLDTHFHVIRVLYLARLSTLCVYAS